MIIRDAVESDLAGILKVHHRIFPAGRDPSAGYKMAIRDATVLVAENEGEVIGFGVLRAPSIEELYTLPEHQGGGTGTLILEKL